MTGPRPSTARRIMKITQLLVSLAALCVIVTEVGCVSADRQMSQSSLEAANLNRDGGQSSVEFSQQMNLNQLAFQKPDLDTNGPVTLDARPLFDASVELKDNSEALDVNNDGQINATEFLTQTLKHSERYHFFGEPEKTNKDYSSRDMEEFQPEGLQLFSIHF
jgi:hypothetical protein